MRKEIIEKSIKALQLAAEMSCTYYGEPLIITYSGGKDSDVMLHLADSCLRPTEFEVLNSHTTVDAPETVYHIRKVFERLKSKGIKATIRYPIDENGEFISMWKLIVKKQMPPKRLARYCCSVLKETSTQNRLVALGVREAESSIRQGRDTFGIWGATHQKAMFFLLDHTEEVHYEAKDRDPVWDCTLIKTMRGHGHTIVNPIYEWKDSDIWEYIRENGIETNPLYNKGYTRVGCIGCPMAAYRQILKEFKDYPKYELSYKLAFDRMLKARKAAGKDDVTGKIDSHKWETGEDVFNWWIEKYKNVVKGQIGFDENMNFYEE